MGKFDHNSYSNSSGLNGVGLSCINALSDKLTISVTRTKQSKACQFKRGILTSKLQSIENKTGRKSGTTLMFYPDLELFGLDKLDFDFQELNGYFRRLSFLNPGLKFTLENRDTKEVQTFLSTNGIRDYLNYLMKDGKIISNDVYIEGSDGKSNNVKIILNYSESADNETIRAFCNSIWNSDGGTHVTGFKMGLVVAFKNFIKEQNLIPKKAAITIDDINGDDVREGLVAIIDLKHQQPLYASQTKLQLTNRDTQGFVQKLTNDSLYKWLTSNLSEGKKLALKIIDNTVSRKIVKKAKDSARKSSLLKSSKLSDCNGNNKEDNELWIVEGLSAGGSAKSCRNRKTQAIYSLRGKPLNSQSISLHKVLSNNELSDLVTILGGVGSDYNPEKCKYGKVVIMADADIDGLHIACLLMTFLFRFYRNLIEEGRVHIAATPLYSVKFNGKRYYFDTDKEKDEFVKDRKSANITRFKGLGEMNADQLWETTMNPKTRKLIKVDIRDLEDTSDAFVRLMGKDPDPRKVFIIENAKFSNLDV